ncbi:PRC-barrel domain-containing protein [Pelomonas sp. KK5]|uniref:PRC-barrel domain-containing protein n=1 Tax=Pelomonas sp. KK5 TaxID=1855730 RepID=UPI00097BB8EA|nr:PRC-barrel domain-containing protein [Pelomonas sp. KK5]
MLNSVSRIRGTRIHAVDGDIGQVSEAYFDDDKWVIRYLVVDTGSWLAERKVLISPYSVKHPVETGEPLNLSLSREQVRNSPDIDTHQPISRRHEREVLGYYAYPDYWDGADLWAMGGYPFLPLMPVVPVAGQLAPPVDESKIPPEELHLRSSAHVDGYDIQATDGSIGHVKDFVFDDESWAIRYLLVDTRNFWPGGKKVLIAPQWIKDISWTEGSVAVRLSREQVKASPEFDENMVLDRDYERRLYAAYGQRGYWDDHEP